MEVLVTKSSLVCWSNLRLHWLQYGALYSSMNIVSHKCHFHVVRWPLINPRLMLSLHLVSLWRTGSLPVKCWNTKTITTDKRFVLNLNWKGRGNSWWAIGKKTIIRHFTNIQFANALGDFDNTSQILWVCRGGGGGGDGEGDGGRGEYPLCCCMDRVCFPKIPRVYNWRAPAKGGVCTYFVAIFQVARNLLKFGMLIFVCVKKCPWVSSVHKRGNEASNTLLKVHPPPPLLPSSPPPPPPMV